MITVGLRPGVSDEKFRARFLAASKAAGFKFDALHWRDHEMSAFIRGGNQIITVFRNLFMIVVVTVAAMSIANTMMKSVSERTQEIATFRSLGFYRRDIQKMFALEGLFLSTISCGVGLVAVTLISVLLPLFGIKFRAGILSSPIALKIIPHPLAWILTASVIFTLAVFTAWTSSRRASEKIV
jgi:putative ABC transport system permease protein